MISARAWHRWSWQLARLEFAALRSCAFAAASSRPSIPSAPSDWRTRGKMERLPWPGRAHQRPRAARAPTAPRFMRRTCARPLSGVLHAAAKEAWARAM